VETFLLTNNHRRARGTVCGWGAVLQTVISRVRDPMKSLNFFSLPNPPSRIMTLGFTQSLAEMNIRIFLGLTRSRRVRLISPSVRQLRRQRGILNIWHFCRHPRPVTGTPLLFRICRWCSYVTGNTPVGLHGLLPEWLYCFIYVDDVRTLQKTLLWTSMACYGDRFTVSYM
jgi:hypothetical protein